MHETLDVKINQKKVEEHPTNSQNAQLACK